MVGDIGFIKIGIRYIPVHEIRQIAISEQGKGYIWVTDNEQCDFTVSGPDLINIHAWLEKQVVLYLEERHEVS